ncbi:MAG: hypothetical protein MZV64_08490 [Ignavibacteriales bacterium]|nr:hypothetical protein [Ignavibacteriales bacterium]
MFITLGQKKKMEKLLTNGGRVLGVTSVLPDFNLMLAKDKAYEAINKINFDGYLL